MKSNYLNNLEREFYFVTDEERDQIISEYEVHFDERIKDGATEAEVISDLGSPKAVAIEYATELEIKYSAVEKYISNTTRHCRISLASFKQKIARIRNEEATKRNNKKQYVMAQKDQKTENELVSNNQKTENGSHPNDIFDKIGLSILTCLYGLKTLLMLIIGFFVELIILIIAIIFGLGILIAIAIGIFLPLFFDIYNYHFAIWFLIYGSITSAIVFFATICFTCVKYFGSKNE